MRHGNCSVRFIGRLGRLWTLSVITEGIPDYRIGDFRDGSTRRTSPLPYSTACERCFVLGDVVEQAQAQCNAALIWDSLGYGAENGGRTEGLAGATRGCKPGCVLVTYDVLPKDSRLSAWRSSSTL